MPQLIIKTLYPKDNSWKIEATIGEWDTVQTAPRIGESLILLDELNRPDCYTVDTIEHLYATVFNIFRLYHIILYTTKTVPLDIGRYNAPRRGRPSRSSMG